MLKISTCFFAVFDTLFHYVFKMCYICHSVSVFLSGNLSAPGALLRPPALVTLTRDAVKVCSASNIILQMAVAGAMT